MKVVARRLTLLAVLLALAGAGSSTYTLQWGDTLSGVARRFGVPVRALTAVNGISDADRVREGRALTIPDQAQAGLAVARPIAAASSPTVHRVALGETLGTIARRYKVSIDQLQSANGITNPHLVREGRELRLPAGAEGGAAPVAAAAVTPTPQAVCPVKNAGKFDFSNSYGSPRHGGRSHAGNDIFARRGRAVLAPATGTLRRADGSRAGLAFYIDGDDGFTYYGAHLDSIAVGSGRVQQGTVIGTVGTTGNAKGTPPHLHFELKPGNGTAVDPYSYLRSWCQGSGA